MNNYPTIRDFKKYLLKVEKERKHLTSLQIAEGLWKDNRIIDYGSNLIPDPPIIYLTNKVKLTTFTLKNPCILVMGDGVGRLARNIALQIPRSKVIEIDSEPKMIKRANYLARIQNINNFQAVVGNCLKVSYPDKSFDYVLSFGLTRYLNAEEAIQFIGENLRLSRYGITVSDGKHKLGNPQLLEIRDILKSLNHPAKLKVQKMKMYRMSVFYLLFKEYKNDIRFRRLVNSCITKNNSSINILSSIAGFSSGFLYTLDVIL